MEAVFGTLVQLLRPIPAIAMVPFALLWFGLNESSKYFLVFWGVFHPVWINTHIGIQRVDLKYQRVAESLGATRRQIFMHVLLPGAFTNVVAGLRTGIAIAFICLVAAEIAGASSGLGYRLEASQLVFRVDRMVAALVVLACMGAFFDVVFVWIVRRLAPWYRDRLAQ